MWDSQVAKQAAVGSQYYDSDPAVVAKQMMGSIPMQRAGCLAEVASAVVFLFSDDASYLTGNVLEISGGSA
jgi:NAD(P)-dependent dehydrogenase (short-subunit alcohol dehydrogenase family)